MLLTTTTQTNERHAAVIRQRRAVLHNHVLALEDAGMDGSTAQALRSSNTALKKYGRSFSTQNVR